MQTIVAPVARFHTNLWNIELDSFNEQSFAVQLQHCCKFRLILLFYDVIVC